MGDVIALADFRSRRTARQQVRASLAASHALDGAFYFDLASPFTYLAAERVERAFPAARWIPAVAAPARADYDEVSRRAAVLRLPLTCPDHPADVVPEAMRAAAFAVERGRASAFVLAASRLAWAGGFDLRDRVVIAEAATAAGLPLRETLAAANDPGRDVAIGAAGASLGAERPPAIVLGDVVFAGEERLPEAVAFARARTAAGA